jgi:hypothetical protein
MREIIAPNVEMTENNIKAKELTMRIYEMLKEELKDYEDFDQMQIFVNISMSMLISKTHYLLKREGQSEFIKQMATHMYIGYNAMNKDEDTHKDY